MLIGNFSGQLGIFSVSWEKIWCQNLAPILYREKALLIHAFIIAVQSGNISHLRYFMPGLMSNIYTD